jgi:hypothetical protein
MEGCLEVRLGDGTLEPGTSLGPLQGDTGPLVTRNLNGDGEDDMEGEDKPRAGPGPGGASISAVMASSSSILSYLGMVWALISCSRVQVSLRSISTELGAM